jgi:hypothetical protein
MGTGVALVACRALVGLESPEVESRPTPTPEASVDAGSDAGDEGGGPSCTPSLPQRPSGGGDAGGGDVLDGGPPIPRWFVIRELTVQTTKEDFPGEDLDCVATSCGLDKKLTPGSRGSCRPRRDNPVVCDGPGGVDNGVMSALRPILGDVERVELDIRTAAGLNGLLIYLGRYDGQKNAPAVSAALLSSPGILRNNGPCDGGAGAPFTPCDDGNDEWAVRWGSALPATEGADVEAPLNVKVDSTAYVSSGELIVPGLPLIAISIGGRVLTVQRPIMRAQFRTNGNGQVVLRGVLSGVVDPVRAADVLRAVGIGVGTGTSEAVCLQPLYLKALQEAVCGGLDISLDRNAVDPVCDGISLAFQFEARPAKPYVLAPDAAVPVEPDVCADAGPSPATLEALCP